MERVQPVAEFVKFVEIGRLEMLTFHLKIYVCGWLLCLVMMVRLALVLMLVAMCVCIQIVLEARTR